MFHVKHSQKSLAFGMRACDTERMTTTNYDIHSSDYRPTNVRVEYRPEGASEFYPNHKWVVVDFNGEIDSQFTSRDAAEVRRRTRAGVIKAALTRRANKAATTKAGA